MSVSVGDLNRGHIYIGDRCEPCPYSCQNRWDTANCPRGHGVMVTIRTHTVHHLVNGGRRRQAAHVDAKGRNGEALDSAPTTPRGFAQPPASPTAPGSPAVTQAFCFDKCTYRKPMTDRAAIPARIGPVEFGELRCPHDFDHLMRTAGDQWEPGTRRWLMSDGEGCGSWRSASATRSPARRRGRRPRGAPWQGSAADAEPD